MVAAYSSIILVWTAYASSTIDPSLFGHPTRCTSGKDVAASLESPACFFDLMQMISAGRFFFRYLIRETILQTSVLKAEGKLSLPHFTVHRIERAALEKLFTIRQNGCH